MRYRLMGCMVCFLALAVSGWAQEVSNRYEIHARVDVQAKAIVAHQRVSLSNRSSRPFDEIYFHIYPNRHYAPDEIQMLVRYAGYFKVDPHPGGFQQGEMHIDGVSRDGEPLAFSIEGEDKTLLKVLLPEPLRPGQAMVLEMDFSVGLPHTYGRLGWHGNIIQAAYWYPILCAQTASGWSKSLFYPFHRPFYSDASIYDVSLDIPSEYVLIHSGNVLQEKNNGALKTLSIRTDQPIRSFAFAMSPDYQWVEDVYHATVLRCYYLPGYEHRARQAVDHLKTVFAFYEQRVGPYAYHQFSVAPVHLGYGGEQMANMIFIDTRVFELPQLLNREFDFLIAHEAGHQWFYNMIGVNGFNELWLEEGVNSYFSLQYLEDKYGYNAAIVDFPQWFEPYEWMLPDLTFRKTRDYRYQSEARMGHDGALATRLNAYDDPSQIFSLIYGKGARVMEAIRDYIGEDALTAVFQRVYQEYRFKNWGIKDFQRLCEEESGLDLQNFFDQWIYGHGHGDYAVRVVGGRRVILSRLGQIVQPVAVRVILSDGTSEEFIWDGVERQKECHYPKEVRQAIVDPAGKFFDLDRVNNVWPRRVSVKAVPLYVGLYDIPLFLPDDAYQTVVGPEIHDGLGIKASFQRPYEYVWYGGTDYRIGEDILKARVGYYKKNIFQSPVVFGTEFAQQWDFDGGREDVASTKVYVRKDFDIWPYGLLTTQDHVSAYLIRNQRLNADNEAIHGSDDDRNLEYRRKEESILGVAFHWNRSAPYPDPKQGYRMNVNTEYSGHMLGGQQYFYRSAVDAVAYQVVTPRTKIASRLKVGLGYPDDKDLFQLGGMEGLRGYPRKSLRGTNMILGAMEYRVPVFERMNYHVMDHMLGLKRMDASFFVEAGQTWWSSFERASLKKDAGISLRFHIDIGGFLEKVIVHCDVAQAINDSDERPRFWLGVNSTF